MEKSHIWENSSSWDMAQNDPGQSDCTISEANVSLEYDTNSLKLKVDWKILGWVQSKLVFPLWSQDSEIGCISQRN